MARTKNYRASPSRRDQAHATTGAPNFAQPLPEPGVARIDMVALLGPDARFAMVEKNIDLSDWLGRGIDPWVWAAVTCLRAILLSGVRQTSTVTGYASQLRSFFTYLTEGRKTPRVTTPADLSPAHIEAYIGWVQKRAQQHGWTEESVRTSFHSLKSALLEMFTQGFIPGEPTRFFKRASLPVGGCKSHHTSLNDTEQERLAQAIKADLVAVHHERLRLNPADVQALRLLLVAHRQGTNPTPLLELRRDAMAPGALPGTIRIRTVKQRNKRIRSCVGRDLPGEAPSGVQPEEYLVFPLAEGAVLQQAISSTEALVDKAPTCYKNRVWLYRSQEPGKLRNGLVTCLTVRTLTSAIYALIRRHQLLGDDGQPLRLNLSRLRKSFFDRALRITDGDLAMTANLMGNTSSVAAVNYPSMNGARKAEAAKFMNDDYLALMLGSAVESDSVRTKPRVIAVKPLKATRRSMPTMLLEPTPVSSCKDTLNGEHAPRDGNNHCDRYVMCLFCSSFAIVGTVDELWRLFSFQMFAKAELERLDAGLGPERTSNDALEDLRDRYRLAIPYIDDFTQRQFPARSVREARAKTEVGLHPYWVYQMAMSRRAQAVLPEPERNSTIPPPLNSTPGDRHGR